MHPALKQPCGFGCRVYSAAVAGMCDVDDDACRAPAHDHFKA
jgi:hypothetical protein